MVAFKKELYREVKMKIVSRPDFVTNEINQKASAMGYALGYALRPMLVRTVPGASMFVSGNAVNHCTPIWNGKGTDRICIENAWT